MSRVFKDSKFSGEISGSIEMNVHLYDIFDTQYFLSEDYMALFLIRTLNFPARMYFMNHVPTRSTHKEIVLMMTNYYNSYA